MKLFVIEYNFSRTHHGVLQSKEVGDRGTHGIVVFRKNCLKDTEIVLSHFVNDFIECLLEGDLLSGTVNTCCSGWVSGNVKHWGLKGLCHHVIAIQNF